MGDALASLSIRTRLLNINIIRIADVVDDESFSSSRTHGHGHVDPTPLADFRPRAACTDIIVVRQVDIKHQLSFHWLESPRFNREVVLQQQKMKEKENVSSG